MNSCTYPFTPENIEAAHRRAARIHAMRNGEEIPNPETAQADMRPGSADDRHIVAMLEGKRIREAGEHLRAARGGKPLANAPGEWANHEWANEGAGCFLAIGPQIKTRFT